jgi:hypothetical protein
MLREPNLIKLRLRLLAAEPKPEMETLTLARSQQRLPGVGEPIAEAGCNIDEIDWFDEDD